MASRMNQMRKFYKAVSVRRDEGCFRVCLDGRPVKSASLKPLEIRSERVAHIIRVEFEMQREHLLAASMPMVS